MESPTPEPDAVIRAIRERNHAFYSDKRGIGALKDLQQTFPNPWLYVAELLQNAVDAEASRIAVLPHADGSLVLEHNGVQFTERDVESLCMRGVSSKGAGTVGFMGIGFKSVFRSFERVQVSSSVWRFGFTVANRKGERFGDNQRNWLGAVLPDWDEKAETPASGMRCRFHLSRRLPELPPTTDDLSRVLGQDESLLALLAWQGVKELVWGGQTWTLDCRKFPIADDACRFELAVIDRMGVPSKRWVLFAVEYQPSDHAIARFLEHRQLTPSVEDGPRVYAEASRSRRVAIFSETNEAGDPLPVKRGSAFALLPTGVTFPLGVHVQADWLLVVSRRELMQIEGNEWHEEILRRIPILLEHFLTWLVGSPWSDVGKRHRGYDSLPGDFSDDSEPDKWFEREEFREALKTSLANLSFLPVPQGNDSGVSFVAPSMASQLPRPLSKLCEGRRVSHRILFGDRTFSSELLGARAQRYLNDLGLLRDLTAQQLEDYWRQGAIGNWYEFTAEDRRDQALSELISALATLDLDTSWRNARFPCLPTEAGGWVVRREALRYPPDWAVLAQEDDVRKAIEPLVGDPSKIVRWSFDRLVQQSSNAGPSFLAQVVPEKLESLTERWWETLPTEPDETQVALAIRIASWVRSKQPQRKNLVRKLLARDTDGRLWLLPVFAVLLAEPFADKCRRNWFDDLPSVAQEYLTADSNASPGDWRSFFESLSPSPQGKFALLPSHTKYDFDGLKTLMGDDYGPPEQRSSYLQLEWRGISIDSTQYVVLDSKLPARLGSRLDASKTLSILESRAIATWIAESPGFLKELAQQKLAYIPFGKGLVELSPLALDSSWKKAIQTRKWIFTASGDGPLSPEDVLAEPDPTRTDAPVADLAPEFVRLLKDASIEFGKNLPDAPAILRLRVQGPSASVDEILRLARLALIEASTDPKKRSLLRETISHSNLFPLPPNRESPDRLTRVPVDRVVRTERGRSTFGYWLAPADSYAVDSAEGKLFSLFGSFVDMPVNATSQQALGFLAWVWSSKPEADRVRSLLPRAYQYIHEDKTDETRTQLEVILHSAVVYDSSKRQWMHITDQSVFLNDLPEGEILPEQVEISLATPGHLSDDRNDRIAIAAMLRLKLLSRRFRVRTIPTGSITLPHRWQRAFATVQRDLSRRLASSDSDDRDATAEFQRSEFTLSHWEKIETIVLDNWVEIQRSQRRAAISNGIIAVTGLPEDFADEVCRLLFNEWGLRLRRDLVDLIPKVAIRLSRIGDESFPLDSPQDANLKKEDSADSEVSPAEKGDRDNEDQSAGGRSSNPNPVKPSPSKSERAEGSHRNESDYGSARKEAEQSKGKSVRGHTASDREGIIKALMQKRDEIERQLIEAASTGVVPIEIETNGERTKRGFQSDDRFREAVREYEQKRGRTAIPKSEMEEGHDIDSFVREKGTLGRKLLRRIEVKGKGVPWTGEQIVEQSDRQYGDASRREVEAGITLAADFDYWLYVVEDDGSGKLTVLPIRNPAKRAAHYEFRAGTWRHLVEIEAEKSSALTT